MKKLVPLRKPADPTSLVASTAATRLAEQLGDAGAEKPNDDKTVKEIISEAQAVHKDTTATARRALRVVEDTKQMKANMLTELDKQNQQLDRLDDNLHQLNEELTYSEKVLRYMRRCCCCQFFDSCTGADPEDQRRRTWERDVDRGRTDVGALYSKPVSSSAPARKAGKPSTDSPESKYRDPDTNLGKGHERTAMQLADETRKQNEMIDKIHDGLDELLDGAKMINDELSRQDKILEHVDTKAGKTNDRMANVNTKSQLRKYRVDGSRPERKEDMLSDEALESKLKLAKMLM